MRKGLIFLFLLLPCIGAALPLTKAEKKEAQFFTDFLQAVYALRDGDSKSVEYLKKTLAASPDSKYIKRLLVGVLLEKGEVEEAAAYVDFAQTGENDAEDWSIYGQYQWKKGDLEDARASYEKALALKPEDTFILYQYVMLLSQMAQQDFEGTVRSLEKLAVENSSLTSEAYTALGQMYAKKLNFKTALVYYNKAIEADPNDPMPRLYRGELYEKASQYFLMLHDFEELEKMGYSNAGTLSRMGSVFILVQDYEKAEDYFLKAKEQSNGDVPSAFFLSLLAEKKGDYENAIRYLKDADDYAQNATRQLQVSFFQQKLNRQKESQDTLAAAYKAFPDNVEIGFFYGLCLNDAKQYKKARSVWERVLSIRPSYTEARLHYAYTLEVLKKYKQMEEALRTVIEEQPKNATALNLYAYYLATRNERLELAQQYVSRALAVMPNEFEFIDTQAWIYYRQGHYQQALDLLQSLSPEVIKENAEIGYHLGEILYHMGRTEEALTYLEAARGKWKDAEKLYRKIKRQKGKK